MESFLCLYVVCVSYITIVYSELDVSSIVLFIMIVCTDMLK